MTDVPNSASEVLEFEPFVALILYIIEGVWLISQS
jgi:hypothetical protein